MVSGGRHKRYSWASLMQHSGQHPPTDLITLDGQGFMGPAASPGSHLIPALPTGKLLSNSVPAAKRRHSYTRPPPSTRGCRGQAPPRIWNSPGQVPSSPRGSRGQAPPRIWSSPEQVPSNPQGSRGQAPPRVWSSPEQAPSSPRGSRGQAPPRVWSSPGQAPSSPRGSRGQAPPRVWSSPGQAPGRAGHTGTVHVALIAEHPQHTCRSELTQSTSEQDLN